MNASATSGAPVGEATLRRRHGRHYLINPRFQLKYTALLVGVVLAVMAPLGAVIWNLGRESAQHAEFAAVQAEKALRESQVNSQMVRANALADAADNPDLQQILADETAQVDQKAERNLADVRARLVSVHQNQQRLLEILLGAAVGFLVLLTVMGIFLTHRIVGPAFKMKRLLRQVGTGRLVVKERLRRGDELGDLFDTFLQMTYSLKSLQLERLATLELAIEKASGAVGPEAMARLEHLRRQMEAALGEIEVPSSMIASSARK